MRDNRTATGETPPPARAPIARADFIEGMAKGMAVLEGFDTHRQRLNATQAAERAGLTRASARRHLLTLVHLGYLESDGHWYWLTPKVLRLSGSYLASAHLPRIVQPVLDRLALQTGCACSAVVCDGDDGVVVARSNALPAGHRILVYGLYLGARLPLHATSTGQVLLAGWPEAQLLHWLGLAEGGTPRALRRLTGRTETDAARLHRRLLRVRKAGHCLSSEEHEPGVHAVAVPLGDAQGRVHGAINAIAPPRLSTPRERLKSLVPLLREAAAELRPLL